MRVTVDFLFSSPKVQKDVGALAGFCWVVSDSKGSYLKDCTPVVGVAGTLTDSVAASAMTEKGSVVMPWTGASESAGTLAAGL